MMLNDMLDYDTLGNKLQRLAKVGLLGSIEKIDLPTCEYCFLGKATKFPFGKAKRANFPLQLIHSNICDPMNVKARLELTISLLL